MLVVYGAVLLLHEVTHGLLSDSRHVRWLWDGLASAELAASTLTLAAVLARFGPLVFAACALGNLAVVSALSHDRRFPGRASVLYPFRDALMGSDTVVHAAVSCIAMVVGGVVGGTLVLPAVCDLMGVLGARVEVGNRLCGQLLDTNTHGIVVEAIVTFLHICIYRQLIARGDARLDAGVASRLFAFATVFLVMSGGAAARWISTGGYANAMLATAAHYPCAATADMAFLKVYWLGPLLGLMLAMALFRELRGAHRKVKLV